MPVIDKSDFVSTNCPAVRSTVLGWTARARQFDSQNMKFIPASNTLLRGNS